MKSLSSNDIEIYEAVIDIGGDVQSVADLINLIDNLDYFQCLWNVSGEYDLGFYWIKESGCYNLKELGNLANYFDYEKYGRDIVLEQCGTFCSSGYVYHTDESFHKPYDDKDIPGGYSWRIFDYLISEDN